MAVTQAQIDALKAARNSGTLTVRHGETTVTYRSLAELNSIIRDMEAELNGRNRRTVAKFNRGL